jgi:hypothetical protein
MSRYVTIDADIRSAMGIRSDSHDAVLELFLTAAEDTIDEYCGRPDGFLAPDTGTSRQFVGRGDPWLLIDECVEVELVEVKESPTGSYVEWEAADWEQASGDYRRPNFNATPYNLLLVAAGGNYSSFTSGAFDQLSVWASDRFAEREHITTPTVRVTARWGYAASVPNQVKMATVAQASIWYKRGQSANTGQVGSNDLGELTFPKTLDPTVKMMLTLGRLVKRVV